MTKLYIANSAKKNQLTYIPSMNIYVVITLYFAINYYYYYQNVKIFIKFEIKLYFQIKRIIKIKFIITFSSRLIMNMLINYINTLFNDRDFLFESELLINYNLDFNDNIFTHIINTSIIFI